MKIKINTKTTISGIDLHWNYQKHITLGSIYTGTIKNTYPSTFGSYIKELLVQKYWQLIHVPNNCGQYRIVSYMSRTVQYRVPRCPIQYRLVQVSTELSSTEYRDVQFSTDLSKSVPKCPGTEMSSKSYAKCSRLRGIQASTWKDFWLISITFLTVAAGKNLINC